MYGWTSRDFPPESHVMKAETKETRRAQIESAAYQILEEKGFTGASMLSIAKRAKCSNETLYNWYGDKTGLFRDLITRNAADVRAILQEAQDGTTDPLAVLERFGPALLHMLVGPRAVTLNRAAAAEPTGALGAVLAQAGRDSVFPLLSELLQQAQRAGQLGPGSAQDLAETYLGFLVGDLQIRRVVARAPEPDTQEITRRATRAAQSLQRVFPAG
jgi:AcrR family transcriptional regulator